MSHWECNIIMLTEKRPTHSRSSRSWCRCNKLQILRAPLVRMMRRARLLTSAYQHPNALQNHQLGCGSISRIFFRSLNDDKYHMEARCLPNWLIFCTKYKFSVHMERPFDQLKIMSIPIGVGFSLLCSTWKEVSSCYIVVQGCVNFQCFCELLFCIWMQLISLVVHISVQQQTALILSPSGLRGNVGRSSQ